jgi:hypothetical protein
MNYTFIVSKHRRSIIMNKKLIFCFICVIQTFLINSILADELSNTNKYFGFQRTLKKSYSENFSKGYLKDDLIESMSDAVSKNIHNNMSKKLDINPCQNVCLKRTLNGLGSSPTIETDKCLIVCTVYNAEYKAYGLGSKSNQHSSDCSGVVNSASINSTKISESKNESEEIPLGSNTSPK